jgi:20S proteasome alpha/beta subunit
MTTIAISREAMAADTRVVTGGSYWHEDKIFHIGNALFGTAGDGFACLAFLEWYKSPRRNPLELHKMFAEHDRDSVLVFELNPGGIYAWNGWGFPAKLNDDMYAGGSGGMAALEAMRHGMTPDEAVKRAIAHDENTGSPVQIKYLLPPELLPKRKRKGK